MKQYHFLIFPFHREMFSRLLFDAMATGLPITAARSGGNLEVIEDGVAGFLFDQTNPKDLAQTVQRAITRPDLYCEMQKRARCLVLEEYRIERFFEKVEGELVETREK